MPPVLSKFIKDFKVFAFLLTLLLGYKMFSQVVVYDQNFNSSNGGWTSYEVVDPLEKWSWSNTSFAGNTTGHWSTSPFNPYNNDIILYVESPLMDFTGKTGMTLSNNIRYQTESGYDGVKLEYSINGGTWTDLGTSNKSTNWYNNTNVAGFGNRVSAWSGNNNSWQVATFPLPNALNNKSNVKFRYYFVADYSVIGVGVAFDDFSITNNTGTIYSENFNSSNGGWTFVKKAPPGKWNYANTSFLGNTTNHWHIQPHNNYANLTETALTSEKYDLTPYSGLTLQFNLRYDTELDWDGLRVEYTTDSVTWLVLGAQGEGVNWYNNNDVDAIADLAHGWSGDNLIWQTVSITLPAALDYKPSVYFRFRFASDGFTSDDDGAAIDDVKILVQSAYVTKQSGNLNSATTWLSNILPPTNAKVFIMSGHTIQMSANQTINYDLSVLSGGTLNLNTYTLTTNNQLLFEVGSTFNSGTGTVSFAKAGNQTIGKAEYYNLTLAGSGIKTVNTSLSVKNNLNISTAVTFNTNDAVRLISTASRTARILAIPTGAIISGKFIMERYIGATQRKWWHLASPFSDTRAVFWQKNFPVTGDFAGATLLNGTNKASVYTYQESNSSLNLDDGWISFPKINNSEIVQPGLGYRAFLRESTTLPLGNKTMTVIGIINRNDINLPVSYTSTPGGSTVDGWSFVGNPYPCDIDWNSASWTKTNIDNAIYVWDALNSRYTTFVGGVGTNGGTRYIASSQAFWVKANNTSPVLTVREAVKSTNNTTFFREESVENVLYVNVTDDSLNANMAVRFNKDATSLFDGEFDAEYLAGESVLDICSHNRSQSTWYSVNTQPDSSSQIPFWIIHSGVKKARKVVFTNTESFDAKDQLMLLDKYLKDTIKIHEGLEYEFVTNSDPKSEGSERFELLRLKRGTEFTAINSSYNNAALVSLYPNHLSINQGFNIEMDYNGDMKIEVLDLMGKIVQSKDLYFTSKSNFDLSASQGTYLVKIITENQESIKKIVVE